MRYVLTFNSGKESSGSTRIEAQDDTSGVSCFSCAAKNSGLARWRLEKVSFEGDKDFW